jgi:hypothetical protein
MASSNIGLKSNKQKASITKWKLRTHANETIKFIWICDRSIIIHKKNKQ